MTKQIRIKEIEGPSLREESEKTYPTPLHMEELIKNHSTFSNYRTAGKGEVS